MDHPQQNFKSPSNVSFSYSAGNDKQIQMTIILCGCFFLNLYVLVGLIMMGLLSFTTISSRQLNEYINAIYVANYVATNLGTPPIQAIIPVNANQACPTGFSMIELAQWPGTQSGCYCPKRHSLMKGNCGFFELLFESCENINSTPETPIYNWKGSNLCAQTIPNYMSSTFCSQNYQGCPGNICVPQNAQCPITNAMIVSAENENFNDIQADETEGYKASVMADGQLFIVNSANNGFPLYNMEIAMNTLPCLSNDEVPSNLNQSNYILENNHKSHCGVFGIDSNSMVISLTKAEELYNDNGLKSILHGLPLHKNVIENSTAYLIMRFRLQLNSNNPCFQFDYNTFNESVHNVTKMDEIIKILSALIFTSFIVAGFFVINIGFLVISIKKKEIVTRYMMESLIPFIFCLAITTILVIGLTIINYYDELLTSTQGLANQIYQNQCFVDHMINNAYYVLSQSPALASQTYIYSLEFLMWYSLIMTLISSCIFIELKQVCSEIFLQNPQLFGYAIPIFVCKIIFSIDIQFANSYNFIY